MSKINQIEKENIILKYSIIFVGIIIFIVSIILVNAILYKQSVIIENEKAFQSQEKVKNIIVDITNSKDIILTCTTEKYTYVFNFRTDIENIKTSNSAYSIIQDYTLILSYADIDNINEQLKKKDSRLEIVLEP